MVRIGLFLFLSLTLILVPRLAKAQLTYTENFQTSTYMDPANTTLVWNTYYNILHPPLAITYTSGANDPDNFNASVGTGANGYFDVPTYAQFSVGGNLSGNVITIDTSVFPVIQVTYFNLAAGWTIRGQGPNPLWFEVLGPVTIAGIIDCSGEAGQNSDAVTTSPTIGGLGHCSGGNGGNGGYNGTGATQGTPTSGLNTGGNPGTGVAGSGGGGGGGFRHIAGQPQNGSGPAFGLAGTENTDSVNDPIFTIISGGAGGGGGSYNSTGPGYRGASGGGGGGVIRITSVGSITVASTGQVITRGGQGGGGTAPAGGGGGGGSHGGIWFQTPGIILNNGLIDAGDFTDGEDGDNGGVVTGGNNGGRGSDGRTWLTLSNLGANSPYITPPGSEYPVTDLPDPGETYYSVASAYVAQSLSYDLRNTSPTYNNFLMTTSLPNTSTATLMVAGSDDNFVNDNTGFVPITSVSTLNTKRYFKFQLTMQLIPSGFASTPATVSNVSALYSGHEQTNFNLTQACGYIAGGPTEALFIFLELLFLFLLTSGRLGRAFRFRSPKKNY